MAAWTSWPGIRGRLSVSELGVSSRYFEPLAASVHVSGLENPALVGHSMGTEIVAIVAQRHPDLSDCIVLMAPTLEPHARTRSAAIGHLLRDAVYGPHVIMHTDPAMIARHIVDFADQTAP